MLIYLPYTYLRMIHEERVEAALARKHAHTLSNEAGQGAPKRERSLLAWIRPR